MNCFSSSRWSNKIGEVVTGGSCLWTVFLVPIQQLVQFYGRLGRGSSLDSIPVLEDIFRSDDFAIHFRNTGRKRMSLRTQSISNQNNSFSEATTYIIIYGPIPKLRTDNLEDPASYPALLDVCAVRVVVRFAVSELGVTFFLFAFCFG